ELDDPRQKALLEQASGVDGEQTLRPCREDAKGDLRAQDESPAEKPASIETPFERSVADEPPPQNAEPELDGVRQRGNGEPARKSRPANLNGHARAGGGAQNPT